MQPLVVRKINAGELNSYTKLRAFVTALANPEETRALFDLPEMNTEECKALTGYEKMIERCVQVVSAAYKDNDMVIMKKVTEANLQTNIEHIDLITAVLGKIRKALTETQMQQQALAVAVVAA